MKKDNPVKTHSISRRDFLKGTAAGALSIAAAGVLGACSTDAGTSAQTGETASTAASQAAAAPLITALLPTVIVTSAEPLAGIAVMVFVAFVVSAV